jgi:V8-like Glu-specific endopeptidase
MNWTREQLIQLRKVLASRYPDKDDQRRLVTEAQLKAEMIAFQNKAINSWFEILEYAKHQQNGVENILRIASQEDDAVAKAIELLEQNPSFKVDGQPTISQWKGPTNKAQLEKITGVKSTLTDIVFLEVGLQKARSVARVQTPTQLGSGFLIENNLFVTNNHVIPDPDTAQQSELQFNYQKQLDGQMAKTTKFKLSPEEFFKTSKEDDWTIVRVNGEANQEWGRLDLNPAVVTKGNHVNIIQHPNGLPKKIAYLANTVVYADHKRVQYLTDTERGSSGSPVFDMNWNVVALHHAGLGPENTVDDYIRNQGILIDIIINELNKQ